MGPPVVAVTLRANRALTPADRGKVADALTEFGCPMHVAYKASRCLVYSGRYDCWIEGTWLPRMLASMKLFDAGITARENDQ